MSCAKSRSLGKSVTSIFIGFVDHFAHTRQQRDLFLQGQRLQRLFDVRLRLSHTNCGGRSVQESVEGKCSEKAALTTYTNDYKDMRWV